MPPPAVLVLTSLVPSEFRSCVPVYISPSSAILMCLFGFGFGFVSGLLWPRRCPVAWSGAIFASRAIPERSILGGFVTAERHGYRKTRRSACTRSEWAVAVAHVNDAPTAENTEVQTEPVASRRLNTSGPLPASRHLACSQAVPLATSSTLRI